MECRENPIVDSEIRMTHVGAFKRTIQGQGHTPEIIWPHLGSRTLHVQRRRKPPSVAFKIARSILSLTIRLTDRLAVDSGTRLASVLVVRINIIDVDHQARVRHIDGDRRVEVVLSRDTVQPDGRIAGTDLTMDGLAFWRSMDTSRNEPECLDEEVVCSGDVFW
jgi:hypothetical protein